MSVLFNFLFENSNTLKVVASTWQLTNVSVTMTRQGMERCDVITDKFANLISKLNFYKLIPYPMDNSLTGRRRPARQTPEKDVLCYHRLAGP